MSRSMPFQSTGLAIIEALFYESKAMSLTNQEIFDRLEAGIAKKRALYWGYAAFLGLIEVLPLFQHKQTLSRLDLPRRFVFLHGLMSSGNYLVRTFGNLIVLPYKFVYVSSPEVHEALDIPFRKEKINPEPEQRWMQQITPADSFDADQVIEADVVVVGTGAGGAVVAKELAEKGLAVAIIEAGSFYRRDVFSGNPLDMIPMLYRGGGITAAIGNAFISIQMGKAVGGTTLINSGTCFRAPDNILNQWVAMGLKDFTPEKMAPYFERVENIIHVQECEAKYIGPIGEVIKEGCDTLGYSCGPLKHNIIDCDGQGVCTQGCPTDAKQSTNISYIPRALDAAAQLFTDFEVKDILTDGPRATGIRAIGTGSTGKRVTLTCHAKATVLSCGAMITPTLIQKNHLVRKNKWIGKNLTIHPAVYVGAVFPERAMKNDSSIPQGYMIDEFKAEGLTFEGATPPFSILATVLPGIGRQYTDLVSAYQHLAVFGCMIKDTSTGFVRPGWNDRPFVYYNLNRADTKNLVRAMHILGKVYFAAGAKRLIMPTFDAPVVESEQDLDAMLQRKWKAHNIILSAYHALGTARMGTSTDNSAIDSNHECHTVPGLFVVDGSSIPTSLGTNPMETIMAIATRAADKIARIIG
ncbi:MAG: GMC family oxidoreductase [Thermodesulfobacteriota bacterium]|nr:GMC family oxidoreductase [Thermodesulfobacteriota bacterium]